MNKIGTLDELNVKSGDVVEHTRTLNKYTVSETPKHLIDSFGSEYEYADGWIRPCTFRVVSRAQILQKFWKDLSDAEKGTLLLAYHNGEVIEWARTRDGVFYMDSKKGTPIWDEEYIYRVQLKPKIETACFKISYSATLGIELTKSVCKAKYQFTFETIDGKPDCSSVKMEKI